MSGKIIPILKKYRPDLNLVFVDAPPTGIVFVTNLDSRSTRLSDDYLNIVKEFTQVENSSDQLEDMFGSLTMLPSDVLMNDCDHSTFFRA